jgi:hypothetical protein
MAITRTHTHFWGEDELAPLMEQAALLRADYQDRIADNQYVDSALKAAAKDRIDNLDIAIRLMGDRAD